MSNTPISNLPAATTVNGTDQIPAVQSGTTVRITASQIATYINTVYPAPGVSQINTSSPITGGPITSTGTIGLLSGGVTNSYLANMAGYTIKANVTGGTTNPSDVSPSAVLDTFTTVRGSILYRGASVWAGLAPGSNGYVLTSNGANADPSYQVLSVPSGQIAPTGVTAGTYGSASTVPQFTVLASGQISSATNVAITISYTSVTGLGSMATQNASAVAITGGTINGTPIGGSTPAAGTFTNLSSTGTTTFGTITSGVWNGTAIGVSYGGTGATTAAGARSNLGAAASGANSDITSLSGLTTPLSAPQGGTGFGSYTTGDILYADASTSLARLNDVATGNALISGGVGVAPSYGKIGLTTHVSGTLPVANGGTGITSFGTGVATALGQTVTGSGGIVLQTSPVLITPNLGTPSAGILTNATGLPLTTGVTGTLPVANGGTGATTLTGYVYGNGTGAFTAAATIPNAGLTNSSVTIGSTSISLGGTATTLAGLTTVTLTQDPTLSLQATTKQYVDGQVAAVSNTTFHASSDYGTTANLSATYNNGTAGVGATLTNSGSLAAFSVDGSSPTINSRILVKNQTSGLENGIYTLTTVGSGAIAWVLTRATDFNTVGTGPNYIETGASTFVTGGSVNGSTGWVMNTTGTIVVGTTSLVWVQSSSSASVTVTSPLTKVGSVISLGTVPTTLGGTGLTTLTQYNVMLGAGTGNVAFAAPSTTGYPLLSTGAASNPAFGQLSLTVGVTGTLPVANGGTGITSFGTGVATALGQNVTGSGGIVLATSPTLVTPVLGTPSSVTLTNATGLPLSSGVTGTLPVANGGTGTATAFTAGSVVFSGASGVYSQNNTKLFWDNTNIRLGINTGAPNANFTILSNTQTASPPSAGSLPAGTDLYIMGANAANTRITQDAYGTGNYAAYTGRQARGTGASPTASQTDDILVEVTGRGYGATAFSTSSVVRIDLEAAENFTDTAQGTYISFHTSALGAASAVERFRIGPSGQLGIGGATYGTSGYVLTSGGASAAPAWSQVSLTAGVTGILPVANGGTNIASYTIGDLIYASGTTTLSKLADVATGNALISGGIGVAPSYGKIGLTTHVSGTLPIANGGTALTSTPTDGQILIGSTSGSNYALGTLTAGTAIGVTNGSGSITINNTGVTSLTAGTAISVSASTGGVTVTNTGVTSAVAGTNISVSGATGAVTFSTSATPTFATSITSPLVIGGTAASSTLTLESTSGVGTSDAILFKTGSQVERMRIDTSGNVGIGTTTIPYKLVVSGTTNTGIAGFSGNNNGSLPGTDGDASLCIGANYSGGSGEVDYFHNNSTFVGTNGGHRFIQRTGASTAADLLWVQQNLSRFYTGGSERMRIDSSGNVGIGLSTMTSKLQVSNSACIQTSATYGYLNFAASNGNTIQQLQYSDTDGSLTIGGGNAAGGAYPIIFRRGVSTESMRIDASGNVGVGTSTPSTEGTSVRLAVVGTANQQASTLATSDTLAGFTVRANSNSGYLLAIGASSNSSQPYIQGVNYNGGAAAADVCINAWGGNVAIGTTTARNPASLARVVSIDGSNSGVSVSAGSDANTTILSQVNADGYLNVYGAGTLNLGTSNTTRMTINSSGLVGIGTTTPANAKLHVVQASGSIAIRAETTGSYTSINVKNQSTTLDIQLNDGVATGAAVYNNTAGAYGHYWYNSAGQRMVLDGSGNLTATGNVTAYSDARLKKNVVTIDGALALVEKMRGVRYDRIDSGKAGVGVIAQEMQEVLPEVVHEGENLSVAYGNLVGVLIEAVKELSARVKELEAK